MAKILLVEDDKSLREIYGVRLMAEGYEIVSAGDGEEALATAIKERPDLILSDVMMPKISGFDMLDILRGTEETRNIKVIMMTALSSEDQRARGESLGADRYLVKSQVGIEDVVRTVHEVLGDGPQGAKTPSPFAGQPAPATQPAPPNAQPQQPEAPAQQATPQATTATPQSPTAPVPPQPAPPSSLPPADIVNAPQAAPVSAPQPEATPVQQPTSPVIDQVIPPAPSATPQVPAAPPTPQPTPQQPVDIAAQMARELNQAN